MDTIVALATPPGRSAIGVIRLSGPDALRITRSLLDDEQFTPQPNHASLKEIKSHDRETILDRSLLTYFPGPNSYTGEDVVEISCHGSPIIIRQVFDSILKLGGRLADPGEFTLRALGNGKLNLTQAEAIRDLINAQTDAAAQQAVRQLTGELSKRVEASKHKLINVIVQLESALEFVEDDLPELQAQEMLRGLGEVVDELGGLIATFEVGHLLTDGIRVTIAGRPNVGKSSLFNRLLAHDRAIVTEVPGTTRDTLTEPINLQGIPVLLTDTAGIRDSSDRIESMGVERTRRALGDSDLVVMVIDGSEDLTSEDYEALAGVRESRHIVALNKSDLKSFQPRSSALPRVSAKTASISALTGSGLEALRTAILEPFSCGSAESPGLLITNARHRDLLSRSKTEIESSIRLLQENASEEIVVVGLHNALRFLGEITGETTTEEILSQIFATFCIGK